MFFSQDELLAELEKLEKNVDENLFEADEAEDGNPCPKVLTTTLPSHRGKTCRESFDFILAVGCGVCEFMEVVQGFLFFPKAKMNKNNTNLSGKVFYLKLKLWMFQANRWMCWPLLSSGFCREIITKVNDPIEDIIEEQDVTEDLLDSLYTAVRFEVEFNEVRMILMFFGAFVFAVILGLSDI